MKRRKLFHFSLVMNVFFPVTSDASFKSGKLLIIIISNTLTKICK